MWRNLKRIKEGLEEIDDKNYRAMYCIECDEMHCTKDKEAHEFMVEHWSHFLLFKNFFGRQNEIKGAIKTLDYLIYRESMLTGVEYG